MTQKRVAQAAGSALLLLSLVAAENLAARDGIPHVLTLWLLEAGFGLFVARTLLATTPVRPWTRTRPPWMRALLAVALAGALLAAPVSTAALALAALLFFGGILSVEFLDEVATRTAAPAKRVRRPRAFGIVLLATLVPLGLAHYILARAAFQVWGDTPITSALGAATMGLHAATLLAAVLVAAALLGKGRAAMPRRVVHALALVYLLTWLVGYATGDALGTLQARQLPLLAVGIAGIQFFEILFEAPTRLAERARVLPRDALWDLFLALAFGALLVLTMADMAGQDAAQTLFGMKALAWTGLVAGGALVPVTRWRARRDPAPSES